MAWTSPTTASAGTVLTAATWNAQVRSNMQALLPLDALAWSSYTPTLTQSGAVSKTVAYAKYTRLGNLIVVNLRLDCTGSGTANNVIVVSVPVTATTVTGNRTIGSGYIFDASTPANLAGVVVLASTTTINFIDTNSSVSVFMGQTGTVFPAALASTDVVSAMFSYEAA